MLIIFVVVSVITVCNSASSAAENEQSSPALQQRSAGSAVDALERQARNGKYMRFGRAGDSSVRGEAVYELEDSQPLTSWTTSDDDGEDKRATDSDAQKFMRFGKRTDDGEDELSSFNTMMRFGRTALQGAAGQPARRAAAAGPGGVQSAADRGGERLQGFMRFGRQRGGSRQTEFVWWPAYGQLLQRQTNGNIRNVNSMLDDAHEVQFDEVNKKRSRSSSSSSSSTSSSDNGNQFMRFGRK